MEKTSLRNIIILAIKDWKNSKNTVKDEEIIGKDISDATFSDIMSATSGLTEEDKKLLTKTRNGIGADKLGEIQPRRKRQVPVGETAQEVEKVKPTQEIEKDGFER